MYVIYEKEIFMLALLVIFSYLIGSLSTGYIIVKKKFNKDIREFGSETLELPMLEELQVKNYLKLQLYVICLKQ